jgi:prephenate dehydrogenase
MKHFRQIAIVGVGLLGGSIGRAVKKRRLARKVIGFFRDKEKIAAAKRAGAVDAGTDDLLKALKGSDLVILCSPVADIVAKLKSIKKAGLTKTLITDAGSTKVQIVRAAQGLNFVGSHPLAGSEQSGLAASRPDLFKATLCVLTPTRETPRASVRTVAHFWKSLGADVALLSPEEHDKILAYTSHLPHLLAFALIQAIPDRFHRFSAGGLKDTTRIALSSPGLWRDILLSNAQAVLTSLTAFEKSLATLKQTVRRKDAEALARLLTRARSRRLLMTQR